MMKKKKVRYAVVGLGWIAQESILPAFAHASENSQLTALVSDSPDKAECQRRIQSAQENNVKLMIAYRLHFEEGNLQAVEIANSKRLGDVRIFHSIFSLNVEEGNVRLESELGGGTLYDIGIYCINAARGISHSEPLEVSAISVQGIDQRFREVKHVLKIGERESKKTFSLRDQFASEIIYFSDCILKDKAPEPSGKEGLADVRIIEALYRSARDGQTVRLEKFEKNPRASLKQEMKRPKVEKPELVGARSPQG